MAGMVCAPGWQTHPRQVQPFQQLQHAHNGNLTSSRLKQHLLKHGFVPVNYSCHKLLNTREDFTRAWLFGALWLLRCLAAT